MEGIISTLRAMRLPSDLPMWVTATVFSALLGMLAVYSQLNILCTTTVIGTLLLVSLSNKVATCLLTFAYLLLLGDIRRMVAVVAGEPRLDTLLLVGPVVAAFFAVPILLKIRLRDSLSKAMLLLLTLMTVEIFNPKQGGIAVGLSGALFYIVPVLWFWIGREFGTPAVVEKLLYRVVLPLAVAAAILGLCQNFVGFLPYEQTWIQEVSKTYTALYLGNSIRAFGFSVSGAEYATMLEYGAAAAVAAYLGGKKMWLLAFPLLTVGMILASGRTPVIKLVLTLVIIWVIRNGKKLNSLALARLMLMVIAGLVGIVVVASGFAGGAGMQPGNSATQNAIAHQVGGLAHPLDANYSTAGIHSSMIVDGLLQGFRYPIGRGLGSTTIAGAKFSADPSTGSSEMDFSDTFISLGFVGGFTYLFVIFSAMKSALTYSRVVHRRISLPVFAVLTSTIAVWLIGGQYSISAIVFFLIGSTLNVTMKQNKQPRLHERLSFV